MDKHFPGGNKSPNNILLLGLAVVLVFSLSATEQILQQQVLHHSHVKYALRPWELIN